MSAGDCAVSVDAGNSAVFLSTHKNIDRRQIGILGGSEGGRIAVLTASRFAVVTFAISFAGTVVSMEDDRIYAQMGSLRSRGVPDSVIAAVEPLWRRSFAAWASNSPATHDRVNIEIMAASGNTDYAIVVLPRVGHAPVDVETTRMVRIDNIVLNWLDAHLIRR